MKEWHNGIVRGFEFSGAHKSYASLIRFVDMATYHFWELGDEEGKQ